MSVETGFDVFAAPRSKIEVLHRLAVLGGSPRLRYGQSIYSAAAGDAGGAFFWGYELASGTPLAQGISVYGSAFLGGGGGAAQVIGDGWMLRGALGLELALSERAGLSFGASWIKIDGAAVDDLAYSIGLRFVPEHGSGDVIAPNAIGAEVATVQMEGSETRSGDAQPDLFLVGSHARFAALGAWEATVSTAGAASGGEGYMQVMAGLRRSVSMGPVTGFAEAALGFGGGGEVDTGGGVMASLGLGLAVPIGARHSLEFGLSSIRTAGDAAGTAASLRLTRDFARDVSDEGQAWRFSTGMSRYIPQEDGSDQQQPLMQETGIDLYLGKRVYLSGTAATAMGGEVAGFAMGLFGLGYDIPLSPDWALSVEGQIGAAGGGGVDVAGGAVAGMRVEFDRTLANGAVVSLAVGSARALGEGGMSMAVVQAGVKLPFETR